MNAVGAPIPRVDGPAKVTGSARYAAEFHPDGLAYAATHDSTVPAGRIAAIDTAEAERAPGVLLVLTYLNADRLPYLAPAERPAVDPVAGEQLRVLQDAEIRFQRPAGRARGGDNAGAGASCGVAGPRGVRARPRPPHPLRPGACQADLGGRRQEGGVAPRRSRATPTLHSPRHRSRSRRSTSRRASSTTRWSRTPPWQRGRATG